MTIGDRHTDAINRHLGANQRMKRVHLFEFEDHGWFPSGVRDCMTQMLMVVHRMLGTADDLASVLETALRESRRSEIIDLCSGSGGPMPDAIDKLRQQPEFHDLRLLLTDRYPNHEAAAQFNDDSDSAIGYSLDPVDATDVDRGISHTTLAGSSHRPLRTMVCSFHHMRPESARKILKDAQDSDAPLLLFEISDNSFPPTWLFWVGLPLNFVFALVVSLMVRPVHWKQVVFTWLIPILPVCFAWDGAVSNVRTYTPADMDELLADLRCERYRWKTFTIPGMPGKKLCTIGMPVTTQVELSSNANREV